MLPKMLTKNENPAPYFSFKNIFTPKMLISYDHRQVAPCRQGFHFQAQGNHSRNSEVPGYRTISFLSGSRCFRSLGCTGKRPKETRRTRLHSLRREETDNNSFISGIRPSTRSHEEGHQFSSLANNFFASHGNQRYKVQLVTFASLSERSLVPVTRHLFFLKEPYLHP